jgi:spore germination protein YaaH
MKEKKAPYRRRAVVIVGFILGLCAWWFFSTISQMPEETSRSRNEATKNLPSIQENGSTTQNKAPIMLGYYTGDVHSFNSVRTFAPYINIVSVDVYAVQADGSINGSDELDVMEWNDSQGIQTYACISNYNGDPAVDDFDPALAYAAIVTQRDLVIDNLVALAREGGYAGINIDFEYLAYSENIEDDRSAFTLFIRDLADRLHAESLKLIISVPGKEADSIDNTWSYPYDLAALGEAADYLQLMTYDQHGAWGGPGSVSGADWVEECLRYTTSVVDPAKLLIGLPAYGYDWDLSSLNVENGSYAVSDISWKDFPLLLTKPDAQAGWDTSSQSPFVTYMENGNEHVAWFENEESIRIKVNLVQKYNLAGVSMWALGKEDERFWQAVEEGLK